MQTWAAATPGKTSPGVSFGLGRAAVARTAAAMAVAVATGAGGATGGVGVTAAPEAQPARTKARSTTPNALICAGSLSGTCFNLKVEVSIATAGRGDR